MTIHLPKLEPWQKDVAEKLVDIKGSGKIFSVLSSRQCGKSVLMAEALIHFAGNNPNTTSIIVEPTFSQCTNIFQTILKWVVDTPLIERVNGQSMQLVFINGSKIICKSAAQRDSLRGFTCDFLAVDEACFIPEDVFPLILPWTNAKNAAILLVSTPLFREGTFYNFWSNPDNKTSISFDWSNYDKSKYLTQERLDYFRKTMPKAQFEAEFLGKWIEDGAYAFTNVNKCVYKKCSNNKPCVLGIDWGGGNGQDYTWLTFLNDAGEVTKVEYFNDIDTAEQINIIVKLINETPSLKKVLVEKNSLGKVFGEQIKSRINNKSIFEFFITTNDSKKEIIESLITAFQNELIKIPNNAELISQLLHYAREKTKTGYTYNGLSGYHDDGVMSLAFAWKALHSNKKYNLHF